MTLPHSPSSHPLHPLVASSYHDALIRAITAITAIISSYHDALMRCYYLDVKTLIISSYRDALVCWCVGLFGGCDASTSSHRHDHPTIQHPIDKSLVDSVNIRCSTRCLRQQAVEQYMAMVWADGREGFNELRIERLNAG